MQKPDWWPTNPYSAMQGRAFWDIASEAIWAAMSAGSLLCDDCELGDWCTTQPFTPACDIERAWAIYIRGVEEKVSEDEWTKIWPVEPGHYWYHGWCSGARIRCWHTAEMMLAEVLKTGNYLSYVVNGRLISRAEGAVGLWKTAFLPEPPVIGVPFAEEER